MIPQGNIGGDEQPNEAGACSGKLAKKCSG